MNGQHADRIVKTLLTRRSLHGLAAALGALLGLGQHENAKAKRKKKCGPCRRRKKGRCKPKQNGTPCGPCSICEGGRCKALCSLDRCSDTDEVDICLQDCDPPCDTCSRCDPVLGQCEPLCQEDECIDGFCQVQCESPCGDCGVCDFGECVDLCPAGVACVGNLCQTPCSSACFDDEACIGGDCFPTCDPPCDSDQGCVEASGGNTCVDLVGTCAAEEHVCFTPNATTCTANGRPGRCVTLPDGSPYCASGISCSPCEGDIDCQSQGFGPNSRCVEECEFCFGSGGVGCVTFAGDVD